MEFLLNNVFGGIVAPILVLILLYIWKVLYDRVDLSGEWDVTIKVRESAYRPYLKLSAEFKFHLLKEGDKISGTGEKISNSNHEGADTIYPHAKRPTVRIEGVYRKNIFSKNSLVLSIVENGSLRESRTTYHLIQQSRKVFDGNFESTAADSRGDATLKVSRTYFKKL